MFNDPPYKAEFFCPIKTVPIIPDFLPDCSRVPPGRGNPEADLEHGDQQDAADQAPRGDVQQGRVNDVTFARLFNFL